MTTGVLFYLPNARPLSIAGSILPGWYAQFYESLTTDPAPVYSDGDLQTELPNPVYSDAAGVLPAVYLDPVIVYRVLLYTAAGVLFADIDPFDVSRGESQSFLTLSDTPDSYDGEAQKLVRVNGAETALEFVSVADVLSNAEVQIFTSNGTWTKPEGAIAVYAICIGGGGGGGGGQCGGGPSDLRGGGGGGGGGFSQAFFPASLLGPTVSVTVGAGGTAGTSATNSSGAPTSGGDGGTGGQSSFGSHLLANGGVGGLGSTGGGSGGGTGLVSQGGQGASGVTTGMVPANASVGNFAPSGGGAGGGTNEFDGVDGSNGGNGSTFAGSGIAGGIGGSGETSPVDPIAGGTGNTMGTGAGTGGGGGGGGGAGGSAGGASGAAGGLGGSYGGGGGGGGAAVRNTDGPTAQSGAGGVGGSGVVVVITVR